MKKYSCVKCGSKDLFIQIKGNQKGLYCSDCGSWQKWISKDEERLVLRFIESNKA
jgi:DNA-directed RNA polymerase subunit RPC12/RpoP